MRQVISLIGLTALLATIVGATGLRLERERHSFSAEEEPVYLPNVSFLRFASLGYHNVAADLLWFRTISYFGRHYRTDQTYLWLAQMCEMVTDLDPRAFDAYRFCGFFLLWEADRAREGIELLEKGVRNVPDSWLLRFWAGFASYLFINDYGRATEHLTQAAKLPNAPPIVLNLATLLHREQYSAETTRRFLAEMASEVRSDEEGEIIARHMHELQMTVDIDDLGTALSAYRGRFGHEPASLDELVTSGILSSVPRDPFGGRYELDMETGEIRSSTGRKLSRIYQSPIRKQLLKTGPAGDL